MFILQVGDRLGAGLNAWLLRFVKDTFEVHLGACSVAGEVVMNDVREDLDV